MNCFGLALVCQWCSAWGLHVLRTCSGPHGTGSAFECDAQSSAAQTQPMRMRPCSQTCSTPLEAPARRTAASSLAPSHAA